MLRIAIVGAGWAGVRQVEAIRELAGDVAVACLLDSDPAHLEATARALGIERTFTDYADVLALPDVDAVSICTPHALHCPMALEAAAAGKHILVEKPIALTVPDATRMIEAAEAARVRLYVAENLSYAPIAKFLRAVVATGDYVGEITAVSFVSGFRAQNFGYPGRRAWLTEPEHGGTGTWMLHGVHSMAQLRTIFGEVETVYLRAHHASSYERPWLEGTMTGTLTLASGPCVTLVQTSETRLPHTLAGYTVFGDRGTVRASPAGFEVFAEGADSPPTLQPYDPAPLSDYALEIQAFAEYVAGTSEGLTTGRSERRSLAIVEAGYESAATGLPITLRERFGAL